MTTRSRRGTYWATFSEGAVRTTIAAGVINRLFVLSTRQAQVGREYEQYTITRSLMNIHISAASSNIVVSMGLIVQNADIALGTIEPASDQFADWLWWEEFVVTSDGAQPGALITRDIKSQRRARGGDTELYLIVVNRGAVNLLVHRSGRILLKRA